jgi:hypothetical protein
MIDKEKLTPTVWWQDVAWTVVKVLSPDTRSEYEPNDTHHPGVDCDPEPEPDEDRLIGPHLLRRDLGAMHGATPRRTPTKDSGGRGAGNE